MEENPTFEVQTRSESGECRYFTTLAEAMQEAEADTAIWKISFSIPTGERVRLVRSKAGFVYDPIL